MSIKLESYRQHRIDTFNCFVNIQTLEELITGPNERKFLPSIRSQTTDGHDVSIFSTFIWNQEQTGGYLKIITLPRDTMQIEALISNDMAYNSNSTGFVCDPLATTLGRIKGLGTVTEAAHQFYLKHLPQFIGLNEPDFQINVKIDDQNKNDLLGIQNTCKDKAIISAKQEERIRWERLYSPGGLVHRMNITCGYNYNVITHVNPELNQATELQLLREDRHHLFTGYNILDYAIDTETARQDLFMQSAVPAIRNLP